MSAQWAVPTRAGSVESTILSNISYVAQSNVAQRPKRQNPMRQRWGGHPPPAPPWRMAPVAATHLHPHGAWPPWQPPTCTTIVHRGSERRLRVWMARGESRNTGSDAHHGESHTSCHVMGGCRGERGKKSGRRLSGRVNWGESMEQGSSAILCESAAHIQWCVDGAWAAQQGGSRARTA